MPPAESESIPAPQRPLRGALLERFGRLLDLQISRLEWEDLDADVPASVGFTSIYSRSDGVLHWRCCLDPEAEHVEIDSSHCGMAVNPRVYREIAQRLRAPAAPRVVPSPAPRVRREVPIVAVG